MNVKVFIAAALLLLPISSPGMAQSRMCTKAPSADLVSVFQQRSADEMLRCINEIGSDYRNVHSVRFLGDLWHRNADKYGTVAWDVVGSEPVRTGIASVLLLAHVQGRAEQDVGPLHAYLRARLDSGDADVVVMATSALQLLDDPADVEAILGVASRDSGVMFQASTIALSAMCNAAAGVALDRLRANVRNEEQRNFIRETRARFHDNRTGSSTCAYR